jgi:uncharacterized membrane protein YdcZ (DUF606 family)
MPPLVRQTRILLLTQTWVLLVGTLLLMLLVQTMTAKGPLSDETSAKVLTLVGALLGGSILLSVSAKLFRHGRAFGWVLAIIAELSVAFVLYAAFVFGLYFGIAALVLTGIAVWVTVNLFLPEVRRFFFGRDRVLAA